VSIISFYTGKRWKSRYFQCIFWARRNFDDDWIFKTPKRKGVLYSYGGRWKAYRDCQTGTIFIYVREKLLDTGAAGLFKEREQMVF
jgi:hypothetical protein